MDSSSNSSSGVGLGAILFVVFLVLKACLRGAFLETSLDLKPLFDAVFKPGVDVFEVC